MKKLLIFVFNFVFLAVITGYSGDAEEVKPGRGGVLRMITAAGPRVIGYYPEMGPNESTATLPSIERLMRLTPDREFEPFLAESIKVNTQKLTMTIKLRKGVHFHDGSPLDAVTVAWNLKILNEAKKLPGGNKIQSIETPDRYTVVLHLKEFNNLLLGAYSWAPILSKAAFDTKGKDWVRMNTVATGPFRLAEWKRDVFIKWERNPDYRMRGFPYLDGIEVRYIPDPTTASAMMEAGEADVWMNPPVMYQMQLEKKGIKRQAYWPGTPNFIYINTKNADAPTAKLKVREAIEYALDRPAIARALGYGFYTPIRMAAPPGEWGYDQDYAGRSYDPGKAKKLLAEAGYPNGLKLKLLAMTEQGGRNILAETIKSYLDQAGFILDIDIADPGRFFNSLWVTGWNDLALYITGIDETYLATIQYWFGPEPRTTLQSLKMPQEFLDLCTKALKYRKVEEQKTAALKLVRIIADEALIIPIYFVPVAYNVQPWVHMDYYRNGFPWWTVHDDWMEKH